MIVSAAPDAAADNEKVLNFATEELPPFNYTKNGLPAGPAVELVNIVCRKLQKKCSIEIYPWRRAEAMIKSGKVEGIFSVGWNKPREEWLYYSTPVFATEYGFFECNKTKLDFQNPSSLNGKTVGVYGPSNLSYQLEQFNKKMGSVLKIEIFTDNPSLFRKLSRCRLDAVYCNKEVGIKTIRQMDLNNISYSMMNKKINYHIGFSRVSTSRDQFIQFNKILIEMKKNGELKKLANKHRVTPAD